MANSTHIAQLKQGAAVWNAWRTQHPDIQPDLSHADLAGADLSAVDLSNATLHGANLQRTTLWRAVLRDADLTDVRGLSAVQLGGADLSGAQLPEAVLQAVNLPLLEANVKTLQQLFLVLLTGCCYAALTLATTSDARLLTNSLSSELPIVKTPIPILSFYWIAPLILLGVHLYFHCTLRRLWSTVGEAPALFPNHTALDQLMELGLFTGLARAQRAFLAGGAPSFLCTVKLLTVWSPALWIVPLTLGGFWWRYLPSHDWRGLLWQDTLLSIAVAGSGLFVCWVRSTLQGAQLTTRHYASAAVTACGGVAVAYTLSLALIGGNAIGTQRWLTFTAASVLSSGEGRVILPPHHRGAHLEDELVSIKPADWQPQYEKAEDMQRAIEQVQGAFLKEADLTFAQARRVFLAKANLRGATLYRADLFMAQLQGADLFQADLRQAVLPWAYLQLANLSQAQLQGADLQGVLAYQLTNFSRADLREAMLMRSSLMKANFSQADLRLADLSGSALQGASLVAADLRFARLSGADLREADLADAQLESGDLAHGQLQHSKLPRANLAGASLYDAQLQGAELHSVQLMGATLARARLDAANLSEGDLRGANLSSASLLHVNFAGAHLEGANLRGADVFGANFDGANLQGANLQDVSGLTATQIHRAVNWERACYQEEIRRQLNLRPRSDAEVRRQLLEEQKAVAPECF